MSDDIEQLKVRDTVRQAVRSDEEKTKLLHRIEQLEAALRSVKVNSRPDFRGVVGQHCPMCNYCLGERNRWYDHADDCVVGLALKPIA